MHVSFPEMMRAAPEVLRMLGGSSYGLAAEAVEAMMMTHAALDKAYALTRLAVAGAPGPWAPRIVAGESSTLAVEFDDAPLVLYAGILADAAAVRPGCSRLEARGVNGGWVLPYMVHRLARRGVSCRGSWRPRSGRSADEAPALLAGATGGSRRTEIVTVSESADAAALPLGICIDLGADVPVPAGGSTIDFDDAVRRFIGEGRQADAEEHRRDFTALAARIRVAFSERSRAQAG